MIAQRYGYDVYKEIQFEYDDAKSEINLEKHGIDFDEAQEIWEGFHIRAAAKKKGEKRFAVVGVARGMHWTAFATYRGFVVRIISVRRSTEKEVAEYERHKARR